MHNQDSIQSQQQIVGFSYLRAVACVAIVVLHTCDRFVTQYQGVVSRTAFWSSVAVRNAMMWAVPCFLMVTGALLLDPARDVTIKKVYTKYLRRVAVALVVFVLLYRVFDMAFFDGFSAAGFAAGVGAIFTGRTWQPVWYLYMLIGIYLLLPIYRKIVQACSDKELRYLLLIYFIFNACLPLAQVFGVKIAFTLQTKAIYPFYLFAGYAVKNGVVKIKKESAVGWVAGCTVFIVLFTRILCTEHIQSMALLFKYNSAVVAVLSVSIFALVCRIENPAAKGAHAVLKNLDACSFGIYLTHVIALKYLRMVLGFNPYAYGVAGFVLAVVVILACAWAVTAVYNAIKRAVRRA